MVDDAKQDWSVHFAHTSLTVRSRKIEQLDATHFRADGVTVDCHKKIYKINPVTVVPSI